MRRPISAERIVFPEGMVFISLRTREFDKYIRKYIDNPIIYKWENRRYVITSDNIVYEEILNGDKI